MNTLWRHRVSLNEIDGSKKGEKMCNLSSNNSKWQMQMWTEHEDSCAQKIRCEANGRIRLWESLRRKRPELWPNKRILQHDNIPGHDAFRFREFVAKKPNIKMDWPDYWRNSYTFWLFKKLKSTLRGKHFWHYLHPNIIARLWNTIIRALCAVSQSCHEVHSFTNRPFWRRLHSVDKHVSKFYFHGTIRELNCRTM